MSEAIVSGNACQEGPERKGWFVGAFMPNDDLRHNEQVEIKWGQHNSGERRGDWTLDERRITMCVLIAGMFRLEFSEGRERTLAQQSDYVMWGPGETHRWETLADNTITMTIRWSPPPEYMSNET